MTPRCIKCNSPRMVKAGTTTNATSRQRYRCQVCGHRTTTPTGNSEVRIASVLNRSHRFVFTVAQNATPVHKPFLAALQRYCEANDAQLSVIATRYRNPTSQWTQEAQEHDWWASEVIPFLFAGRAEIAPGLVVLGDVPIQPTAVSPLTGLEGMTGAASCIVGHPKIAFKTVATPHHSLPKILATTGAVTQRNYTKTKAGKKGEFHHCFGALVVETDGVRFHIRQLNATNAGSFIDLDKEYTKDGISDAPRAAGLVLGDIHEMFVDPAVVEATFGPGGIIDTLRPCKIVYHDAVDFYSRNHHHRGRPFINIAKHKSGVANVRAEVEAACDFISKYTPDDSTAVIVPSNHNDALQRWIEEADWRQDPENAEFYLETALEMARSARMTESGSSVTHPFNHWAGKFLTCKAILLNRGESHVIAGIECAFHGDKGINGARGSINSFSKISVKSIIGHGHGPGIVGPAYQVGTSSRYGLEYAVGGPSSWLQTHCAVYSTGKRSLYNIIDGKFRA